MKCNDLISIVIPVYNASKYIEETIKSIDTLIILSFGASFFKNIQGLLQSVILKRQFDGYNTLVLSIQKDKNLTSCFESKDILEFRGK